MALFHRKSQIFLFYWLLILTHLLILIPCIKSQNISKNINQISNFNQTLKEYNKSKLLLNDIIKKTEKITLNFFLLSRINELNRLHKKIEEQLFLGIQEEINKENYDKEKISEKIKDLNKQIHDFEKKYNKTNKMFYKSEGVKQIIINYIKVFFIVLIILSIIVIFLICIGSFFILKHQRKYYKLKEEVSFTQRNKPNEKKINLDIKSFDSGNRLSSGKRIVTTVKIHSSENELNSNEKFNEGNVKY